MTAYIFDFDGTLADSFDYVFNWLVAKTRPQSRTHYDDFRGLSKYELALKLRIWPWHWAALLKAGRRQMLTDIEQIKLFEGMGEVIKQLHADGHKLFIVSANSQSTVSRFLEMQGLDSYFQAIEGDATFNKAAAIRRLLDRYQLDQTKTWYVGDEAHDIVSAHRAGIQSMAVTWGYNNLERLAKKRPERLVFTTSELITGKSV